MKLTVQQSDIIVSFPVNHRSRIRKHTALGVAPVAMLSSITTRCFHSHRISHMIHTIDRFAFLIRSSADHLMDFCGVIEIQIHLFFSQKSIGT